MFGFVLVGQLGIHKFIALTLGAYWFCFVYHLCPSAVVFALTSQLWYHNHARLQHVCLIRTPPCERDIQLLLEHRLPVQMPALFYNNCNNRLQEHLANRKLQAMYLFFLGQSNFRVTAALMQTRTSVCVNIVNNPTIKLLFLVNLPLI